MNEGHWHPGLKMLRFSMLGKTHHKKHRNLAPSGLSEVGESWRLQNGREQVMVQHEPCLQGISLPVVLPFVREWSNPSSWLSINRFA